ncbi:hypothetical protein DY000_02036008 [Brassica cretica]|uniref:Protein transport protein Sec61 subunit beta n=1 Tax=Brassica cretica TaxID=69181 RepID=A0ABQ7DKI7_BRACR|nr:hypothetical protein DY000_02036008 [Brassica cretica]
MATSVESSSSSSTSSEIMEDSHSPAIPQSPLPHPLLSSIPSAKIATTTVENAASWIDETMRQALVYQSTIVETLDSKIDASKSRLAQIRDTSITHTSQTIDSIREIASEYNVYEHMVFAKIKDGVNVAASHPLVSGGLAFGVGIFALKKTRRFVYYNAVRMFSTEEALLSRADLRVKELRQSLDRLTAESEKLEVSFFSPLEGYRLLCRLPMYAVSQLELVREERRREGMVGSGAPQRGSAAAAASMRRRKPSGSGGGASGGAAGSMLQFYTDDAPGLKISPNVVLVMSIGFIAFVAVLHVMGKLYFVK